MNKTIEIVTNRLILRQWKDSDLPVLAGLNADPDVMRYFPACLTEEQSNKMAEIIRSFISARGWGFWAVERQEDNCFIGFVGLYQPSFELPFTPCVEIGWRLAKEYWGNGYATEAAQASLKVAFNELNLDQVYSFTPVLNKRSQAVMERLNMKNTHQNFAHPMVPDNNPNKEHLLYKITRQEWLG